MDNDRIEKAIAALRGEVAVGFAAVDGRLAGVDERLAGVDERLAGVDQQFAALRREGEETRSQLTTLIDSVRDDVRIFAEAHLALERRVTTLERRPR